jgi:glycogen operon protein
MGVEGPTDDDRVRTARRRQQKNLLATLFLSQGVPMLLAGDEFSRTQRGNNNAYCQDNEISWVDWTVARANRDLVEFVHKLIDFRQAHPVLRRNIFFSGSHRAGKGAPDILWYGTQGHAPDWHQGLAVACLIHGHRESSGLPEEDDSLFMVFNADAQPAVFQVPAPPGRPWLVEWSTQENLPAWVRGQSSLTVDARSVTVLLSPRVPSR